MSRVHMALVADLKNPVKRETKHNDNHNAASRAAKYMLSSHSCEKGENAERR